LIPDFADVILVRHLLWALPDAADAVAHWAALLRPGGRFVLVEGAWATGAGLTARQVVALVEPYCADVSVEALTDPVLWGGDRLWLRGAPAAIGPLRGRPATSARARRPECRAPPKP